MRQHCGTGRDTADGNRRSRAGTRATVLVGLVAPVAAGAATITPAAGRPARSRRGGEE